MRKIINLLFEYALTVVSTLGVGLYFWLYSPKEQVSAVVFSFFVLPLAISVIFLTRFIALNFSLTSQRSLPRLKAIAGDRYVFEPNPLFSNQTCASLYFSDEYEILIGFGYVESVLEKNDNLQVKVIKFFNGYNLELVKQNKNRILLKPTMPYAEISATLGGSYE